MKHYILNENGRPFTTWMGANGACNPSTGYQEFNYKNNLITMYDGSPSPIRIRHVIGN